MKRSIGLLAALAASGLLVLGCSSDGDKTPASSAVSSVVSPAPSATATPGADGSTGNHLSAEYCARNQDPACPKGSYVGPNAIPDPKGGPGYVPCEGTICTNPNHGAGDPNRQNNDQGDQRDQGDQGDNDQQGPPEPGQNNFQGPGEDSDDN